MSFDNVEFFSIPLSELGNFMMKDSIGNGLVIIQLVEVGR